MTPHLLRTSPMPRMRQSVATAAAVRAVLAATLLLSACRTRSVEQAAPTQLAVAWTASAEDPAVATVNGKPVPRSCVRLQLAGATAKDAALEQALEACIELELLSQQASADADALAAAREAQRQWLANLTTTRLFSEVVTNADKLPAEMVSLEYERIGKRFGQNAANGLQRPEVRRYRYIRLAVPENQAGTMADIAAQADIKRLASKFRGQRWLGGELQQAKEWLPQATNLEISGGSIATDDPRAIPKPKGDMATRESVVKPFADALYSIPAPGYFAEPVRTKWGWDLVYLEEILPAKPIPRAELAEQHFTRWRQSYFAQWVGGLAKELGWESTIVDSVLARIAS